MDVEIIENRLKRYNPENKQDELNAFKEIAQEITLCALSRANFFKKGCFQGGTCLRIIYGLQRFSEDLDFILYETAPTFKWEPYLKEIELEFQSFGFSLEVKDRSEASSAVKRAFLKENSFGQVLKLKYERNSSDIQSAMIKLEIDTNPPKGSTVENKLMEFPSSFSIITQTMPSLFAGKLHALLCRKFIKGRDWYDFIWYVAQKTSINYNFLQNALNQDGPWKGKNISVNQEWLKNTFREKIKKINWTAARNDVQNLIKPYERQSLNLWDSNFFLRLIDKIP